MIVFTMELWRGGDETRKRVIAQGTIANVGGDAHTGHYDVRLSEIVQEPHWPGGEQWVRVRSWPRLARGPLELLREALRRWEPIRPWRNGARR